MALKIQRVPRGGVEARVQRPAAPQHTRVDTAARISPLDGLRGLALLAVLYYHAAPDVLPGGFLGVEMFFVLSGFLLTALLLDEDRRAQAIDRWAYAGRRFRRIVPALAVLLAALTLTANFLPAEDAHRAAGDIGASALGLTNWHLIQDGSSYFGYIGRPPLVRHLWSIAVEVQAYVLLPFVVAFIARRPKRTGVMLLAFGAAISVTLMTVLSRTEDPYRAYYGTDTRLGAILVGALVAFLFARRASNHATKVKAPLLAALLVLGVLSLAVLFKMSNEHSAFLYPAGFLATQAATVALVIVAMTRTTIAKVLGARPLRWIGTRSYGIYLWHWPLVVLLQPKAGRAGSSTIMIGIVAAFTLGAASYRFVERPVLTRELDWQRHTGSRRQVLTVTAVATIVVMFIGLLARTPPTDPIAQSLAAGEHVLQSQAIDPLGVPAPPPAPGSPQPPRAEGTPAPRLIAIGDSVMLGAVTRLRPSLGEAAFVDADQGRQFAGGIELVRQLREAGRLGEILVVHLGNNGPVKPHQLDALVNEAQGVAQLLFVTVRVNKPWQDETNATLTDGAARYPFVGLLDWHGTSEGHGDWFYSDGTHVTGAGADEYTNLIVLSTLPAPPKPPVPETLLEFLQI